MQKIPIINNIYQFSSLTSKLLSGDLKIEYNKLIRQEKFSNIFYNITMIGFITIIPLMYWLKESNINWTVLILFFIVLQTENIFGKIIIQLKLDMIKLAALNAENLKLLIYKNESIVNPFV